MDDAIEVLRSRAPSEIIDYGFVIDCLKKYRSPRTKLTQLLKVKALIRVKKGLYIFGPLFARNPYVVETLANMIYGPSYVSLEWALQKYGMIPERVEEITSVTFKRTKLFNTPIGRFSYAHRPLSAYPAGIVHQQMSAYQSYLIATPEKALVDLLIVRRGQIATRSELEEVLFEDFRIEVEDVQKLHIPLLKTINHACPHSAVTQLITFLQRNTHE
jgi:hypothetical protein